MLGNIFSQTAWAIIWLSKPHQKHTRYVCTQAPPQKTGREPEKFDHVLCELQQLNCCRYYWQDCLLPFNLAGIYIISPLISRAHTDLGWPWPSARGTSGSVWTVVSSGASAQSEAWDTRDDHSSVPWPQRSASGDAQELVDHQWQYQLEDYYRCSKQSKCQWLSNCRLSEKQILPNEGHKWE